VVVVIVAVTVATVTEEVDDAVTAAMSVAVVNNY
jgi:hypothetical protein